MNQESPNPLNGEQSPEYTRPTSTAECGSALDSGTGGHAELVTVPRVLTVEIRDLDHAQWLDLLLLSRECAMFCNATIADHFARELGYGAPTGGSVFRRFAGRLSGDVRVALSREARTQWRMHKTKILRGEGGFPFFNEKRSLVCRAEHMSKGKRQRHAWIERIGKEHFLNIRLIGKNGEQVVGASKDGFTYGRKGERHLLKLWWKPQIDERNAPVMNGLASGDIRLLKVAITFKRPGKKVMARLAYEKRIELPPAGARKATIGPLLPDGTLWLKIGDRPLTNYASYIHRLIQMKEHFEGLRQRIRARTKRSGTRHQQARRKALVNLGTFSAWSRGYLHQMSADIVGRLEKGGVGFLTIAPISLGELPLSALEEQLKYKCAERNIAIERMDLKDETTMAIVEKGVAKKRATVAKGKKALRVLRETINQKEEG